MTSKYTFSAPFENPGEGGAFVTIPSDIEKAINEAKQEETRLKRLLKASELLEQGKSEH